MGFRIRETKPYTTPTGEVQKVVYEGTLNQNGEAIVDIRLKNRTYVITTIVAPETENACYVNNTSYTFHRNDDNLKFDFLFAPCAYLKLKIENVNCEGPDDVFDMNMGLMYDKNYTAFWFTEKYGCYSNEFNDGKVPSGEWFVEWWVTRNGSTNHFTDTIELIENELLVYEINY